MEKMTSCDMVDLPRYDGIGYGSFYFGWQPGTLLANRVSELG
jgi:hypothetical protein